jgi:purine nucleosidase
MNQKLRLLLDVDTGTDDALALLLALTTTAATLEGVTTGVGNVSEAQATLNTLKVLELAGAVGTIPVARGAERPLQREWKGKNRTFHGEDGLGDYVLPEPEREPLAETAADFIVRQVNENPGELTLVCLGRLTNLATALVKDPAIAPMIARLVLMGGAYRVPGNINSTAESNMNGDPEAARLVFESGIPLTMVGLDVTTKVLFGETQLEQLRKAAPSHRREMFDFVEHLITYRCRAYQQKNGIYATPMHDPLAVAIALDPSLAVTETASVRIETQKEGWLGATLTDDSVGASKISVCVEADAERFCRQFIDTLAGSLR